MNLNNAVPNAGDMIRKYASSGIVVTDSWNPNGDAQKLTENNLLSGELSAVIFQVGCYTVRSALRVYKLIYNADCDTELDIPADKEDVEFVKKGSCDKKFHETFGSGIYFWAADAMQLPSWKNELRICHEISAKHTADLQNEYICVCRIAQSVDSEWCEYIGDIYTVKENVSISDADASLLVYSHYESSSLGADTWFKLEPSGKVTKLQLHPFDSKQNEKLFDQFIVRTK